MEKAREFSKRGVKTLALERPPSLQEGMHVKAYDSLIIGNCKIPPDDIFDELAIILKAYLAFLKSRSQRPMVLYAYNQDPENALTGYALKKLFHAKLVVVHHHLEPASVMSLGQGFHLRRMKGYHFIPSVWRSLLPALNRHALINSDIHFSISAATKAEVKHMLDIDSAVVVGNGLDRTKFVRHNTKKVYDAAFLGRLVPQKGVDILLYAWRRVVDEKCDAKLVIIGGGAPNYLAQYERIISELNLTGNVVLTGFLGDEELVQALNLSRLFVFPSRREGFAQAVSQAMACGLCCILSDIPSLREVYGGAAVFIKPDSPKELSSAILGLLNDTATLQEISKKGYELVSKLSWSNVADKEFEALRRTL